MGCTSSTEVSTDPVTGQRKEKKRLGGAYPGNRPPQHAPYTPDVSQFQNGQAVAHFVSTGGGNALVLQNGPKPTLNTPGAAAQYVEVKLPPGVNPGDTIHVQAPNGDLNEITVPAGMSAGSTFTVEFDHGAGGNGSNTGTGKDMYKPTSVDQIGYNPPVATATTYDNVGTATRNDGDDGFASGFSNAPTGGAVPTYTASGETYQPSFSAPPSYPPPPKY